MISIEFHYITDDPKIHNLNAFSTAEFRQVIEALMDKGYRNIKTDELLDLCSNNEPYPDNCFVLSFDDSIKITYDEIRTIMNEFEVQGIFFVNTLPVMNHEELSPLEKQRVAQYLNGDYTLFFNQFCNAALELFPSLPVNKFRDTEEHRRYAEENYYPNLTFYKPLERYFRILRGEFFSENEINQIFQRIIDKNFDEAKLASQINMKESDLKQIVSDGHIIGAHTHSHPNKLGSLSYDEQFKEIEQNSSILKSILGKSPTLFSYPTNSFNEQTIEIIQKLGYKLAFKAEQAIDSPRDYYRIPRVDAALLRGQLL